MGRVLLALLPVLLAALLPVAAAQPTSVRLVVDATRPVGRLDAGLWGNIGYNKPPDEQTGRKKRNFKPSGMPPHRGPCPNPLLGGESHGLLARGMQAPVKSTLPPSERKERDRCGDADVDPEHPGLDTHAEFPRGLAARGEDAGHVPIARAVHHL